MREPLQPDLEDITVTTKGVHSLLTKLSPFESPGPDNIPPFILKDLADYFAPIFTILFQASINQATTSSIVPDDWKHANISPVFKKGDPLHAAL